MKDKRLIVGELVFEDCLRKWSLGIDPVVIKSHTCQVQLVIVFVIAPPCGLCNCCSFDMIEADSVGWPKEAARKPKRKLSRVQ